MPQSRMPKKIRWPTELLALLPIGAICGGTLSLCYFSADFSDLLSARFSQGWTSDATHLLLCFIVVGAMLGVVGAPALYYYVERDNTTSTGRTDSKKRRYPRIVSALVELASCTLTGAIGVPFCVLYYFADYRPTEFSTASFESALLANATVAIGLGIAGAIVGLVIGVYMAIRTLRAPLKAAN